MRCGPPVSVPAATMTIGSAPSAVAPGSRQPPHPGRSRDRCDPRGVEGPPRARRRRSSARSSGRLPIQCSLEASSCGVQAPGHGAAGMASTAARSATGRLSRWWSTSNVLSSMESWRNAHSIASRRSSDACGSDRASLEPVASASGVGRISRTCWRPRLPQQVAADVHEYPVEPGIESHRRGQPGQLTPGSDERLLRGIGRIRLVAQDGHGASIEGVAHPQRDRVEGRRIAHGRRARRRPRRWTPSPTRSAPRSVASPLLLSVPSCSV